MRNLKKVIGYILFFVIIFNCGRVFASEIVSLDYYGFSDNVWANLNYSIKTSDGGVVGIATVNPNEFGVTTARTSVESLVKMNGKMEVEWVYPLETTSNYSFTDIVEDNNHNFVLVGKGGYDGAYSLLPKAAFLVVNSKGKKIKEVEMNTVDDNFIFDSIVFDGEYFYSAGYQEYDSLLSEDSDNFYLRTKQVFGLYKFTSDFKLVWFEKIYDGSYEWKNSKHVSAEVIPLARESYIDITSDGDIVFAYDYKSNNNIEVFRYDKNGNLLFDKKIGGTEFSSSYDTDTVSSLVATEDNGVVVVGNIESNGYTERLGSSDAFYLKLDKDGNIVFEKYLLGDNNDTISLVDCYYDKYVMVGNVSSNIKETDIEKGKFMMIVDESGNILNVRSLNNEINVATDSILTIGSKIYISGYADNKNPKFSTISKRTNLLAEYSLKYDITVIDDISNVTISVADSAMAEEEIEFTVSLDEGYLFKGFENIEVTPVSDNTYKFKMPPRDVDLKPIVEKEPEKLIDIVMNPNTSDIGIVMLVIITILVGGISIYNYRKIN